MYFEQQHHHGKLSVAWFVVVAVALPPADGGVPDQGDSDGVLGIRLGVLFGVRQGLGPELDPGGERGGEADEGLEYLHLQN